MAQDSGHRQLDDFVQNYFQDLRQDLLQVKTRLDDLQGKLDQRLDRIAREPFLLAAAGGDREAGEGEEILAKLAEALQSFGAAADEESVLEALSQFGNQMASRVLLLVRRDDRWVRFAEGKLDSTVSFPSGAHTIFQRAAESRAVVAEESARYPAHADVHQALGGEAQYCVAVPLLFGDSVPAVFYADTTPSKKLNVAALEVLCQGARLAIRALHLTDIPSAAAVQPQSPRPQTSAPAVVPPSLPPVARPPTVAPSRASAPATSREDSIDFSRDILGRRQREWDAPAKENVESSPSPQQAPAAQPSLGTPPPSAAGPGPLPGTPYAPMPQPAPEPPLPVHERTSAAPASPFTPAASPDLPQPAAPKTWRPEPVDTFPSRSETPQSFSPAAEPAAVPQSPSSSGPQAHVSSLPSSVQPAPAAQLTPDEERQHADARRFARLLVSELKLYNEQAVVQGRRNRDIYTRLKQDIERSREMFNRRVPAGVTRRQDYFHEELVKLLAEGDMESLGSEYPGSRSASA